MVMEDAVKWAIEALGTPVERQYVADRLKEALQAAPSREPDAVRYELDDLLKRQGFTSRDGTIINGGTLGVVDTILAALRSVPDGAAGEPVAWQWYYAKLGGWCNLADDNEKNRAKLEREGYKLRPLYALPPATPPSDEKPIAMLGGIHGVCLIRHIENMQPDARKEYHTPLYRHPPSDERAKVIEACAKVADNCDKSTHPAEVADRIRALSPTDAPAAERPPSMQEDGK